MEILITLIILVFSAIVHEVSHGIVAEKFGDSTARDEGRITLNPIPHIDPFASILLPAFLLWVGSPIIFGAAKPVPVNFNQMRNPKLGMALVSLAGPLSNFGLAVLLMLPVAFGLLSGEVAAIWLKGVVINIVLGTFNLLPIPPLDGSKFISSFLPTSWMYRILSLEQYGFILVLVFLMLGLLDKILIPVVTSFFALFGVSI